MESLDVSEILKIRNNPLSIDGKYRYEDLPSQGDIRSVLNIYLNVTGFRLKGSIDAQMDVACDRCLERFERPVSIQLDEQFVFRQMLDGESRRSGDQEMQLGEFYEEIDEQGELDIKDLVRQMLVMEVSAKQVCGQESCLVVSEEMVAI